MGSTCTLSYPPKIRSVISSLFLNNYPDGVSLGTQYGNHYHYLGGSTKYQPRYSRKLVGTFTLKKRLSDKIPYKTSIAMFGSFDA